MTQVRDDIGIYNNTFTGTGINVGQIESKVPDANHAQLTNLTINTGGTTTTSAHATEVARTLAGTSFAVPVVSGFVARLMQEYPALQTSPDMVQAVLIASATPVNGHTAETWDIHAGAGRVHYERAREATRNAVVFANATRNGTNVTRFSQTINVANNARIRVVAHWQTNSQTSAAKGGDATVRQNIHTNYDLVIRGTALASRHASNIEILWHQTTSTSHIIDIVQMANMPANNPGPDRGVVTWIYESSPFITSTAGMPAGQIAITGVVAGHNLPVNLVIPEFVNGRTVTQIGSSAFSGQNQLTQINILSTVTHIGIEAFKNTNNAPIYLEGRTSVPQTFRNNWNSSGNPVYLDGNLCTHLTTTLKSCCSSLHGDLCDTCKTFVNKSSHNHNYSYTPKPFPTGLPMHEAYCQCGHSITVPCGTIFPSLPGEILTCFFCGQELNSPQYMLVLPNGVPFFSESFITYEMFKQIAQHFNLSHTMTDYTMSLKKSLKDNKGNIALVALLPNKEDLFDFQ